MPRSRQHPEEPAILPFAPRNSEVLAEAELAPALSESMAEFLRAGAAGDLAARDAAFNRLYLAASPLVHRLLLRLTGGDSHLVDDLCQEVFSKISRGAVTPDPDSKPKSWISALAANTFVDHVSRQVIKGVRTERGTDLTDSRGQSPLDSVHDRGRGGGDPALAVMDAESNEDFRRTMDELTTRHRALLACMIAGMSYQEMSDLLSIPIREVKSTLFTATRRLREAMLPHAA